MSSTRRPTSEYLDLAVVAEHLLAAADMVGRDKALDFRDEMHYRLTASWDTSDDMVTNTLAFDSPLEAIFWLWWHAALRCDPIMRQRVVLRRHEFLVVDGHTYNIDFVVGSSKRESSWPLIAIELDGHTFHEKTLEQVTYRNQRDRALQQAGWRVFHFSWDEFTKRPSESVYEVLDFVLAHLRATYVPPPAPVTE